MKQVIMEKEQLNQIPDRSKRQEDSKNALVCSDPDLSKIWM